MAKIDKLKHRPNSGYGENIYETSSIQNVKRLGIDAVNRWYSEVKYFDFNGSERKMSSSKQARNKYYELINYFNFNSNILMLVYILYTFQIYETS